MNFSGKKIGIFSGTSSYKQSPARHPEGDPTQSRHPESGTTK
jgi:hypothetical protein